MCVNYHILIEFLSLVVTQVSVCLCVYNIKLSENNEKFCNMLFSFTQICATIDYCKHSEDKSKVKN